MKQPYLHLLTTRLVFTSLLAIMMAAAALTSYLFIPVYAQTTLSPTTEQIDPYQPVILAGGEFVMPIVERASSLCTGISDKSRCVGTIYASDNVVVLTGEYLPEIAGRDLRGNNPMLWMAVDEILAQGFIVRDIAMSGTGVEANPHVYTVVMTKSIQDDLTSNAPESIAETTNTDNINNSTQATTQSRLTPPQPQQPSSPAPTSPSSQQLQSQQQAQQPQNGGASVSIVSGSSSMTSNAYSPNPAQVSVGGTVTWTNDDSVPHTVTSGENVTPDAIFESGVMAPAATFEHTFTEADEYPYFCLLHPNMVGTVIVR
jgi:plastocyanin